MPQETRDFLIRKMPIEVYTLLENSAKEHNRSKTQEAIVILKQGLISEDHHVEKPIPLNWKRKLPAKYIDKIIRESRK